MTDRRIPVPMPIPRGLQFLRQNYLKNVLRYKPGSPSPLAGYSNCPMADYSSCPMADCLIRPMADCLRDPMVLGSDRPHLRMGFAISSLIGYFPRVPKPWLATTLVAELG